LAHEGLDTANRRPVATGDEQDSHLQRNLSKPDPALDEVESSERWGHQGYDEPRNTFRPRNSADFGYTINTTKSQRALSDCKEALPRWGAARRDEKQKTQQQVGITRTKCLNFVTKKGVVSCRMLTRHQCHPLKAGKRA
jgi:hypothetical protein